MASYRGATIFGRSVSMQTSESERDQQLNAFFGLNGVEALDGGGRGGETVVTGVLAGAGVGGLASAEALFRSYQDGRSGLLITTLGVAYPEVKLLRFLPHGRISTDPAGICYRPYQARFMHLV